MADWGVVHHCQGKCGAEVQYLGYKLFDAGTLERHRCPRTTLPPTVRFVECLCGADVQILDNTRYDAGSNQLHVCHETGLSDEESHVTPIKRTPPVVLPNVKREPNGVIHLG